MTEGLFGKVCLAITYGGGLARVRDVPSAPFQDGSANSISSYQDVEVVLQLTRLARYQRKCECVEMNPSVHSDGCLRTIAKLLREAPERSSFLVKDAPVRRSGGLSTCRVQR